jgi:hypothetical protein
MSSRVPRGPLKLVGKRLSPVVRRGMPIRLDCPGSLLPLPCSRVGDETQCPVCGRTLPVLGQPPIGYLDPWPKSTDARLNPHSWGPKKEWA